MILTQMKKEKKIKFNSIGLRMIKTSIAVFLCLIIFILRGQQGMPFYSVITAVFCMQPYLGNSKTNAKERTFGTFNGAFWGCIVLIINTFVITEVPDIGKYLFISTALIPVIYTAVMFRMQTTGFFSSVVFLSITVNHLTDANPYLFVLNRVIETMIGIVTSILVNQISLPRIYRNDILLVSGIDEILLNDNEQISPYNKVELNRMIERGAKFTIATERTIASMMDSVKEIHLNLPIIAFNGAILYDMKKKEFSRKKILDTESVHIIQDICREENVCCFTTAIIQDTLLIYYEKFFHSVEEQIYNKLRISPYRNYIEGNVSPKAECFYLMCIDKQEHITKIYHRLKKHTVSENIRMVRMISLDYPGYTYLKIYHKDATKQNMLVELKSMLSLEKSVTFGTISGQYDVLVNDNNQNTAVKMIKQIYEPCKWRRGGTGNGTNA
ncbi:MAG: hypothetical protein K0R21_1143 [Anaerocolumna sp.]|jgi:hydroxymethylpyrimidine pyrophosphatase-like HAD family hydrolase|nr:hypothetical protein [Anaerocolumna sp.]